MEADRIIVMEGGQKVMEGTPKEIFRQVEELKRYRLDVPAMADLAYRLRKGRDQPAGGYPDPGRFGGGPMPIILDNVSYTYQPGTPNEVEALKQVNLKIKSGSSSA